MRIAPRPTSFRLSEKARHDIRALTARRNETREQVIERLAAEELARQDTDRCTCSWSGPARLGTCKPCRGYGVIGVARSAGGKQLAKPWIDILKDGATARAVFTPKLCKGCQGTGTPKAV